MRYMSSNEAKAVETKKKTVSITNVVYNVLLVVCAILALQFMYHIAVMADHYIWHGEQYAPQTYGAIAALIVCVYIWAKGQTGYQRYVAAVLISLLVVGYGIWLLGKFGLAGKYYLQAEN